MFDDTLRTYDNVFIKYHVKYTKKFFPPLLGGGGGWVK
jgi:hypothetical protein